MQLKDVIHFYIGCEAEFIGYYNKDRFINILDGFDIEYIKDGNVYESVKPILKKWKLSKDITTEAVRLGPAAYFHAVPYLCAEGFDLFGLIESREAIDQETLKKEA